MLKTSNINLNIKTGDTCIRISADVNQINKGIKLLDERSESLKSISQVMLLMGNETRLKMVYLIYREKQMCVCDLGDTLHMSVSAISQHLRKLKDGKLLKDNKIGQTIFYSINDDYLETILPVLSQITKNKQ